MKESTCWLPLLLLSIFHLLLFSSLVSSTPSFKPVSILLNCGSSSDDVDADKRRWTNDSTTHFGPSNLQSSFTAQTSSAELPSVVPYQTARIFTSASSYNFTALPEGRHFVRLHFLSAVYNDRDPKNAFFSVTTGPYTLLSNFSPAITALANSQAYIMREFFVIVSSSGYLTLTFTPSPNTSDSFAFINGIEIVSSPELFPSGASTVPTTQIYPIRDSDALQTIVRLNVGGAYVSPTSDSALSRTWYDDLSYIFAAGLGVTYSRDPNVSIQYSKAVPEYIAPRDVYGTARSMGPNASVNQNYNLTWSITVDNGFRYLIRLHFCEIQSEVFQENQRVFNVYVNDMTADHGFDVIFSAKKNVQADIYTGVAVYRDYMVIQPRSSGKQSDVRIELHPDVDVQPYYGDAILNGLEVFKVNDSSGNLAGPNPDLLPPAPAPENSSPIGRHGGAGHSHEIAGAVGGIAAALVVGACICCLLCGCQRKKKEKGSGGSGSTWVLLSPYAQGENGKSTASSAEKSLGALSNASSGYCRHFRFSEIVEATDNFSESLLLGAGGFGKVYKGVIDGGNEVAVKRGSELSQQGAQEFHNEIEMLSKLRHRHLVPLIGYCEDSSEMILVYEYMARGNLREHLYGRKASPLSWRQRLEICIGAAKGLHHLHTGAKHTLIHRDVKSANILLDGNWVAKISDFGLSKMGSEMDRSHVSTGVKGTFGYLDPEYHRLQRLTEKSDVYSFGVVLFEVLSARPALDRSRPTMEVCLAEWALRCMRKGVIEQIVDPFLSGKIAAESLRKFAETAEKCLADEGADRPAMTNVLWNLEFALSLQSSAEEADEKGVVVGFVGDLDDQEAPLSAKGKRSDDAINWPTPDTLNSSTSFEGGSSTSMGSEQMHPSAVFSQIMNPKGR
ncbi:receptor-like protein kinase FERONIA isoform X3 [Nymphaea colorata]|uniref:receptor-like protein kinase FERONIA isoform X3 n=1 Tax=Nymphaea colorata TaxID=210225 RepID=UPI00214F09A0|nr:receptor-like protein kinase FERONIA isoform X3 [Nymphaea colorata]